MSSDEFRFEAVGRGLGAMLLSNPANPTGQSLEGEELKKYVEIAREQNIALLMDEFYSHYYYDGDAVDPQDGGADDNTNWPKTVSSASYIDDIFIVPELSIFSFLSPSFIYYISIVPELSIFSFLFKFSISSSDNLPIWF